MNQPVNLQPAIAGLEGLAQQNRANQAEQQRGIDRLEVQIAGYRRERDRYRDKADGYELALELLRARQPSTS